MLCAFGFSQNAPITFETGQQGADWTFASFENSTGIGYEKVANPFVTGINTSATVGKFTALVAGAPWAGCESAGIGKFTLNASNSIIKIMVYKSVISDVGLKFSVGSGGAQAEIKVKNTKINEWEELTFDCSGNIGKAESIDIEKIIFFLDFQARTTENVCYFDNVTFSAVPLATTPVVAAPTPGVLAASDVISLFSGAYTNLLGTDWTPGWGQTTVHSDITIAENATKKYTNFNYQGIVPAATIDASGMTKLHLDVWSPDCTAFEVFLINPGPVEQKVILTPTLSGWNSFDVNLSDFTSINLATIFQLKLVSPTAGSTVYLDNIYFYKAAVVVPSSLNAPITFETGDFGADWIFTSFENGIGIGYEKAVNPNMSGINISSTVGKFTALTTEAGAAPWAGCESAGIGKFSLDATNSTVKIMVYKSVISDVGLKFAIASGGAQAEIKVKNTKINEWEELTFDCSGNIGKAESIDIEKIIFFLDFQARTTENVCYFDNVTFSSKTTTPPVTTEPTVAATTPAARPAAEVISLFSDAYTNITGTDWAPNWGQSTVHSEIDIVGNATKKYTNFNYQGIALASSIDVSAMTKLHLDVWSPDCTAFEVYLINPGPVEQKVTITPTLSGWNSFDINLSDYTSVDLKNIFQLKLVSPTAGTTVYLDNLYFSKGIVTPPVTADVTLPLDFESSSYAFVDFDGGVATKIANPHNTGINTSANVAQMVKGVGQPWGGSKIKMASPVDFSTKKLFKVKVLSPVAGKKLLLKFEKADGTGGFEKESIGVTAANTWEELSFDFTGVSGVSNLADYMVFIFDLGTVGDGSVNSTYLFDEITQSVAVDGGSTLTQMKLPVSFDDTTVDYGLIGFGGADASSVVVDPTSSANKVAKVVKTATAESWAGTTVSAAAGLGFSNAIPFTVSETKMSVRIWSPDAGTIVRLKVEEHGDNTHTVETEATVTIAKGWETVVFDFAKPVSGTSVLNLAYMYDKATIFFGFGTTGVQQATEKNYYFDDVMMKEDLAKPILNYGVASQTYPLGKSIYPLTILNTGGQVSENGFSIDPVLPDGLNFDTSTATISGMPSVLSLAATYTVTGVNEAGSNSTTISIAVVRDFKSNNFTIETTGETCLGEKNGEINIKAQESHTYVAIINDKSYEFTTNSLRVFDLAPGVYTISISVKGETFAQSFTAVVPKGSTITGKINKLSYNKLTVVMTEGTAPYKVYLDGEQQFETPFSTFIVDVNKDSLLEVKTAKICEGTYSKNIEGILDSSAVSPNPTSGSFEIAIPTNKKEVVIDLYSLSSVFISSKSYPLENGTVKLSLEGQTDGIYIAKVYLNTPSYLKIIKK